MRADRVDPMYLDSLGLTSEASSDRGELLSSQARSQEHSGDHSEPVPEAASSRCPGLIAHKVHKLDTLAGLAIRYGVSVADIKRANGLLSDNALFARDEVLIPTITLPMRQEVQLLFAQVASGFGRDPVLHADANCLPASSASARIARSLNIINGQSYPPDVDMASSLWAECEGLYDSPSGVQRSRRRNSGPSGMEPLQEVELQDVQPANGPTRLHGAARRRRGHAADSLLASSDDSEGDEAGGARGQQGSGTSSRTPADPPPRQQKQGAAQSQGQGEGHAPWQAPQSQSQAGRPPRPPPWLQNLKFGGGGSEGGTAKAGSQVLFSINDLGRALGQRGQRLVASIKAAASSPALAGPHKYSLSDAAEGVLSSRLPGSAQTRPGAQQSTATQPTYGTARTGGMFGQPSRKSGNKTD